MDTFKWNEEKSGNFRAFFQSIAFKREYEDINKRLEGEEIEGVVNRMNQIVKEALSEMRMKGWGGKREGWFSKKCKEKRKEVKGLLKEFKKENSECTREKFCQGRSEYRRVLKEERTVWTTKRVEEINLLCKENETRRVWQKLKHITGNRGSKIENNIGEETWMRYFKGLLEGEGIIRYQGIGEGKGVRIQEMDKEIQGGEIRDMIKRAKVGKSGAITGLTNCGGKPWRKDRC